MRLQGPGTPERAVAPHLAKELFLREHAVRIRGQLGDELELLCRQQHRGFSNADASCRAVDHEIAGDDDVTLGRGAPAEQRADPRKELLVRERPAKDVVGAAVERTNALDRVGGRCEDYDRHVPVPAPAGLAAAKPQTEVELAEEDEIRTSALHELESLAPAGGSENVEIVVAQLPAEVRVSGSGSATRTALGMETTLARSFVRHQMSFPAERFEG